MEKVQQRPKICPYCDGARIVCCGKRKTQKGIRQIYRCNDCLRRFTNENPTNLRIKPRVVRRLIALVCQGYTYEEAIRFAAKRFRTKVSKSSLSNWMNSFRPPYMKMRDLNFGHAPIVRSHLFTHRNLNYNYQVHLPKLELCEFEGLKEYLNNITFKINPVDFEDGLRCSQLKLAKNPGLYHAANAPVNRLAANARQLAAHNRDRHPAIEEYFISCDGTTIAVEIPVVCELPGIGVVAGHIDILQIYRGRIFILDYKPNAAKENPSKVVTQLSLYAGGLVQQTGLKWDDIRCAYFDEEDYYSFKPSWELLTKAFAVNEEMNADSKLKKKPRTSEQPEPRRKSSAGSWSRRIVTLKAPSSRKDQRR